jgi:predicted nucleic acid-binding protein
MLVIDANIAIALVMYVDYTPACRALMKSAAQAQTQLCVPMLWEYEITSTLRKFQAAGRLTSSEVETGLGQLYQLKIERVPPDMNLHNQALAWAARANQVVAYDAQYLALAESLGAEMWTADKRLYNALKDSVAWLHWGGE